jgi:sulfate permease, SulP family
VHAGVVVIRCESALLYFNGDYVRDRLFEILGEHQDAVRLVIFSLGAVPKVDLAGAELLANLFATFRARAIEFRLTDVHGEVRDALRRIGFDREYGPLESGRTVDAVLSAWHARATAP